MHPLLNRASNHWQARSRASMLGVAVLSGGLLGTALASNSRSVRLLAGWAGVGLLTETVLDFNSRWQGELLSENRALWALLPGLLGERPVRALGGYALSADAVAFVAQWVARHDSRTVVELGPGASTVALDRLLAPGVEMWGVEHSQAFMTSVEEALTYHQTRPVRLIHAPLVDGWYDRAVLAAGLPDRIDVLIVDGPPNLAGDGGRSPALAHLCARLSSGALVLVDDTSRRDESAMASAWASQFGLDIVHNGSDFIALHSPYVKEQSL